MASDIERLAEGLESTVKIIPVPDGVKCVENCTKPLVATKMGIKQCEEALATHQKYDPSAKLPFKTFVFREIVESTKILRETKDHATHMAKLTKFFNWGEESLRLYKMKIVGELIESGCCSGEKWFLPLSKPLARSDYQMLLHELVELGDANSVHLASALPSQLSRQTVEFMGRELAKAGAIVHYPGSIEIRESHRPPTGNWNTKVVASAKFLNLYGEDAVDVYSVSPLEKPVYMDRYLLKALRDGQVVLRVEGKTGEPFREEKLPSSRLGNMIRPLAANLRDEKESVTRLRRAATSYILNLVISRQVDFEPRLKEFNFSEGWINFKKEYRGSLRTKMVSEVRTHVKAFIGNLRRTTEFYPDINIVKPYHVEQSWLNCRENRLHQLAYLWQLAFTEGIERTKLEYVGNFSITDSGRKNLEMLEEKKCGLPTIPYTEVISFYGR